MKQGKKPCVFSEITKAEYERFWLNSALWQTQKPLSVPKEILDVAGDGYKDLLYDFPKEYKSFENIIECTFTNNSGTFECGNDGGYVLYDLGKLYVGFLELEYEVEKDTEINLEFDYTETLLDFTPQGTQIMRRLEISENLEKNGNKLFLLRRRAFRYLKISTPSNGVFIMVEGTKASRVFVK